VAERIEASLGYLSGDPKQYRGRRIQECKPVDADNQQQFIARFLFNQIK